MRLGHDDAPPVGSDPLDVTRDVAELILAVLQRARLIAEHQRAEEHLPNRVSGEDQTDVALRAAELVEALQAAVGLHPAHERRIRDVGQPAAVGLGAELDHPAAVHAVGDARRPERGVGFQQHSVAGDVRGVPALPCGVERAHEGRAPVGQPLSVVGGCDILPRRRPPRNQSRGLLNDLARRAGEQGGKEKGGAHRPQPRQPSSRRPC